LATFLVVQPNLDIYGGAERVCHHVMKTLVSHGQKVELLTFDFDAGRYRTIMGEEIPKEVTVNSLGTRMEVSPPFTIYKKHHQLVYLFKRFRNQLQYDYLFSTQSASPFEPVYLSRGKKNIAYVHFPEIHDSYYRGSFKRKAYLWLFKRWVEQGVKELDFVFCNSKYTKTVIEKYWARLGVSDPAVVYPPVDLKAFWRDTPLSQRKLKVTYVGRFIPAKRHDYLKRLASECPQYEFVSIGGLMDSEKEWFNAFTQSLPVNYKVKPNLPRPELIHELQESRMYVHLMEGEHFGIAPIEALASGCVTLVHDSGGQGEFVPEKFKWKSYEDLKQKVTKYMDTDRDRDWEIERSVIWKDIAKLNPDTFEAAIWSHVEKVVS